ncbi:MAG: A/G-specific adenine glycosylase [Clostridia bacterium]|nr:A/G-specific adenine glycosylase [Clostridia bacterium]
MCLNKLEAPLLNWYRQNARDLPWRHTKDPYRIWVSEIMLQQTRVEAVKPYYARFLTALPDVYALANAPEEQLLKLWEGLGYYSRVRNMQKAARTVVATYDGQFPADPAKLQKLTGIGEYTAGAIASIAFGIPAPAVDGNVMRVLARLIGDRRDIFDPALKKEYAKLIAPFVSPNDPSAYNQGLIELGATVCLPKGSALCSSCPLSSQCIAHREGTVDLIPSPKQQKPRKVDPRTILIIRSDREVLIEKRPDKGLLAGLWQLPSMDGHRSEAEVLTHAAELGLDVVRIEPLPAAKHIFTHIEWQMIGYQLTLSAISQIPAGTVSASLERLEADYPLPSAFSAYLPYLQKKKRKKN